MEGEELISRLNMPETWRRVVRDSIHMQGIAGGLNDESFSGSRLARLLDGLSVEAVTALWLGGDNKTVSQRSRRYLTELRHVEPALNGKDLLRLGVPPGPLVGNILGRLRDDALDGTAATEAGQRRLVAELMGQAAGDTGDE
jgi:tRNA nucleotidyltransferase (CCA-adding enzyme)